MTTYDFLKEQNITPLLAADYIRAIDSLSKVVAEMKRRQSNSKRFPVEKTEIDYILLVNNLTNAFLLSEGRNDGHT